MPSSRVRGSRHFCPTCHQGRVRFTSDWIADENPELGWFHQERDHAGAEPESYDQTSTWHPIEISLGDRRIPVPDDS